MLQSAGFLHCLAVLLIGNVVLFSSNLVQYVIWNILLLLFVLSLCPLALKLVGVLCLI